MPLTPDQISAYHRDGYLTVRGVFADDAAALQDEAERLMTLSHLMDANNIRCRWQDHAETGECRFDCFDPVIDISPVCERIARAPELLDMAGQLYGEQAYLFKDKLIFKPAGAKGYDMHQDFISWEGFPESFMTVIVAIDPSSADSGATEVFGGYHQQGCMSPRDGMYHTLKDDQVDLTRGVALELQPGDVAFFSGFTPHRSGSNKAEKSRRLLYLSYSAARDGGDLRDSHYSFFHHWLQERYAEYGKTQTYFR
ncbi:ectoine hydroxylase-related dioxygenase (phytanoyl-CoA dioxygenase family) [Prosthecobacter fusiformis]|uniref:Ectoine hydroxylase-related dioxygenase (Phytanoyl-CoA dioxygenase family) n=1 Tax=Prosthecobacter fusiformis TaxID=48464 RepID=A0A4R7RUL2_9BACT|nr:phytanoyl-CoA dioxygenase family protein [Prosthecobacter fusiformis]TDU68127.1 ectoine hydroxylase-related dioxygenase (phytanoyl-CoA dioxygenase family) [Prosthecobacter fusiformis]